MANVDVKKTVFRIFIIMSIVINIISSISIVCVFGQSSLLT